MKTVVFDAKNAFILRVTDGLSAENKCKIGFCCFCWAYKAVYDLMRGVKDNSLTKLHKFGFFAIFFLPKSLQGVIINNGETGLFRAQV